MNKHLKKFIRSCKKKLFIIKNIHDIKRYYSSWDKESNLIVDKTKERNKLFKELVDNSIDMKCLQIGARKKKYASHWVSCDLYDKNDIIDFNYDIHNLKFKDCSFDVVVCNAILEHVEDPLKAISELKRVLKSGGLIWIEVPFCQPYHPSPSDYWRVTLQGVQLWMKKFKEISTGLFGTPLFNAIYFFGKLK